MLLRVTAIVTVKMENVAVSILAPLTSIFPMTFGLILSLNRSERVLLKPLSQR